MYIFFYPVRPKIVSQRGLPLSYQNALSNAKVAKPKGCKPVRFTAEF